MGDLAVERIGKTTSYQITGGRVPKELSGVYTSKIFANIALTAYLSKLSKAADIKRRAFTV